MDVEILTPSEVLHEEVYRYILSLAEKLVDDGMIYTRSDLAYDLKSSGYEVDSLNVSDAVWNAYLYFNQPESIFTSFFTNDLSDNLISQYIVRTNILEDRNSNSPTFLEENTQDFFECVEFVSTSVATFDISFFESLKRDDTASQGQLSLWAKKATEYAVGNKGINDVAYQASALQDALIEIGNSYKSSICSVKNATNYFSILREELLQLYYTYSGVLLDLYGDNIKAIEPELFDYNGIGFLDVDTILDGVVPDLVNLQDECGFVADCLLGNLDAAGGRTYEVAKYSKNTKATVAFAATEFLVHHLYAHEKTAKLKSKFEGIKRKVCDAVVTVEGDTGRLLQIFKIVNDLHIPKAKAFYNNAEKVLSEELMDLLEIHYSSEEMAQLQQRREKLVCELNDLNRYIEDCDVQITVYNQRVSRYQEYLDNNAGKYKSIVDQLPFKPYKFQRILTLDKVGDQYNDIIAAFMEDGSIDFLEKYIHTKFLLQLDKNALEEQNILMENYLNNYHAINIELSDLYKESSILVYKNEALRKEFAKHLVPIVGLLRGAREIISSGIEKSLENPVRITNYNQMFYVSEESKEALNKLASFSHHQIDKFLSDTSPLAGVPLFEIAQKTVDVLKEYALLEMEKEKTRMNSEAYANELEFLRSKFQSAYSEIDDKSELIRESLKIINMTKDKDIMTKGLLALADINLKDLTEKDIDDFLLGNKTIEL